MKKLVFALIAALSVALTGCSAFESEPIEPNIIGTGNLQYEAKSGTWFVAIDSIQYTVVNVKLSDRNPRSFGNNIEPVEGMVVTVFTSPRFSGIQAITGRQTAEQIEGLYHTNSTPIRRWAVLFFFAFCCCTFWVLAFCREKKLR